MLTARFPHAALCAAALLTFSRPARAEMIPTSSVTGKVAALPGGLYRYDYAVTNADGQFIAIDPVAPYPTAQVIHFYLDVPRYPSPDPNAPPLGWTTETTQPSGYAFVDLFGGWTADYGQGLRYGESGAFSLVTSLRPGPLTYHVEIAYAGLLGERHGGGSGTVVGPAFAPAAAPEPGSFALLALGGLALLGPCLRRPGAVPADAGRR
jgi:hypothetical protein